MRLRLRLEGCYLEGWYLYLWRQPDCSISSSCHKPLAAGTDATSPPHLYRAHLCQDGLAWLLSVSEVTFAWHPSVTGLNVQGVLESF